MAIAAAPVQTLNRTIQAPLTQVYSSLTDRDWLRDWLCDDAFLRNAAGGHLALFWYPNRHAVGQFEVLEKEQQVGYSLRFSGQEQDTYVEIALRENNGAVDITLQLSGALDQQIEETWSEGLRRLQVVLETGADPRITERVLIGIYPGEFNAEIAAKLNVPVTEGNLVNGVLPGLGAEKAGLKQNDVVVTVDGKPVTEQQPIFQIVRQKRPGDQVEVTYYRDGEKRTATMPLGGYPIPPVPADYEALANQVEQGLAELDKELTALFADISPAEADVRPEPKQWSINENLAHLILNERRAQEWVGTLFENPELGGGSANSDARVISVVKAYGGLNGLLAELRRSWGETVELLRHLPAETLDHKSLLWWLTFESTGTPNHTRQHFTQIRETLAAVRKS